MIWNRETKAEARVGPGRPAAQKGIDKTTSGFAGWSAKKRGADMRLAATGKTKTKAACRFFSFSVSITFLLQGPLGGFRPGVAKPLGTTSFTTPFDCMAR